MIIDQHNTAVHQHILTAIHVQGVFIGIVKKKPDQRINLFYWNRFLVEIHCEPEHHQWTPSKITYALTTEAYMESLKSELTQRQFDKLQAVIHNQEVN